jgi:RimJ/RimL family protein N-acetyltransferase
MSGIGQDLSMTLNSGPSYSHGNVSIESPDTDVLRHAPKASDDVEALDRWLTEALVRDDIYNFSILYGHRPVGQTFLHDMDLASGESLIGYHLFEPQLRGRGIGTNALRLLQQFVIEATSLRKLVIITSRDNTASQAIAKKCRFTFAGAPREDPVNGIVFEWRVPRASDRGS